MTIKTVLEGKRRKLEKIIEETDDQKELRQLKKSLMLIDKELKEIDQKGSKTR